MSSVTLRSSSTDFISQAIPEEVQMLILSHLGPRDLSQMAGVNNHWRTVASDDWLWERFWGRYQVIDASGSQSKKEVLRRFIAEKAFRWHGLFQSAHHPYFNDWLEGVEKQCSLKRYEQIKMQAPAFLKEILGMSERKDDAMRADFFFNYLEAGLPITPLITNSDLIFNLNCKYKDNIPVYLEIAVVILNIRNAGIHSLLECCDKIGENNAECMGWLPFATTVQGHIINKSICDRNVLLITYSTQVIFFSKGASFSELFRCSGFNPNFLLPPWMNFLEFPKKHLGVVASDKSPFLFVFILQFFVLPMITESLTLGFNAESPQRREELLKFDPKRYESRDLPFEIIPQVITLGQLLQDLKELVQHKDIDLEAKDSNGLTTLQLLKAMRESYSSSNEAFNEEDRYILARVISILEMAGANS